MIPHISQEVWEMSSHNNAKLLLQLLLTISLTPHSLRNKPEVKSTPANAADTWQ